VIHQESLGVSDLPAALARHVDEVCNRFESDWKSRGTARLEDYLSDTPEPARAALLRELLALEIWHRRRAGEQPDAGPYLARFPQLDTHWLTSALASGDTCDDAANRPDDTLTGTRIGDYEILQEIARGGMGVVYKARQLSLNRVVALKMILAGSFASPAEVQRFQREAAAVAGLDHPSIVPVYEVGELEGRHFFTMKLVEGGSLVAATVARHDQRRAARIVAAVARAVHYAHQHGILHRDLKPANILLATDGADAAPTPMVTDFGLAKLVEAERTMTQTGAVIGSPPYMAPEQARCDKTLTTAVDVYGLGAVLYELLTGRPPFRGDSVLETLRQVQEREPERPRVVQPRLSADLETICLKCLEKDARRRYGSAEALADDLDRFLAGEPIRARPVRAWERAGKWIKRHPAVAALVVVSGLAALALVGVVVGGLYSSRLADANADLETALAEVETKNKLLTRARDDVEIKNGLLAGALRQTEQHKKEADTQRDEAQHQRALAQRYLYAAHMALVSDNLHQGRTGQALHLLELHAPTTADQADDLRGFEWYYLHQRCRAVGLPLRGHAAEVLALWVSPDGRRALSAGADRTVHAWALDTGRLVRTILTPTVLGKPLAFSPDGTRLASVGPDNDVRIMDTATGREVACGRAHFDKVTCMAFSPDSKHLASGSTDKSVVIWEVQTGNVVSTLDHVCPLRLLAFGPDGNSLATSTTGFHSLVEVFNEGNGFRYYGWVKPETVVWDWRRARPLLFLHDVSPDALAISPDGQMLALTRGGSEGKDKAPTGMLTVLDAATGERKFGAVEPGGPLNTVVFGPDSKTVAAAGRAGFIKVWDTTTGRETLMLRGHTDEVTTLAFSPAAPQLVSGGADLCVRVWAVGSAPEPRSVQPKLGVLHDVAFSPDGRILAVSGKQVAIVDARTGGIVRTFPGINRLAFSPDGLRIAASGTVSDVATGQLVTKGPGGYCVAFSPDGKRIASTGAVWDAQTGQRLFALTGNSRLVYAVAFSPDGKWLATGGEDKTVRVWDAATGKAVFAFPVHLHDVYALTFSPDSSRLAAATGNWKDRLCPGEVKVWDMVTRRELFRLRGHTETVWGVAFSRDGTRLASCSGIHQVKKPGEIKVWDAASGQELLTLGNGHKDRIFAVAFSPDGRSLASAGEDGIVRIWDAGPVR
jgi:WD40 repeat protein